jgi:hypothetical protein
MGRTTLIPSKAKMAVPKKMGKDSGLEEANKGELCNNFLKLDTVFRNRKKLFFIRIRILGSVC